MKKRLRSRVLAVGMVGTTLLGAGSMLVYVQDRPVHAQDKPAATELLNRGERLFQEQQFPEAKAVLGDIAASDLPEDQRARLAKLTVEVDAALAKSVKTSDAFDNAKAAMEAGQLAHAAKLFSAVAASPDAPAQVKKNATLQLALVREKQKEKAPAMRALLAEVPGAISAGRLDEAANALYQIESVGAEATLGPKDEGKIALYRREIAQKSAPAVGDTAVAAAPVVEPAATPTVKPVETPVAPVQVAQADPVKPVEEPVRPTAVGEPEQPVAPTPPANPVNPVEIVTPATPETPAVTGGTGVPVAVPPAGAATSPAVTPGADVSPAVADVLTETIRAEEIARQRALVLINQSISASNDALRVAELPETAATRRQELFQRAVDNAQEAVTNVLANRRFFAEDDYRALLARTETQLKSVTAAKAAFDQKIAIETAVEIARKEALLANERAKERQSQINRLMAEAYLAYDKQNLPAAKGILQTVLVADPSNNAARLLLRIVEDRIIYVEWQRLERVKSDNQQRQQLMSQELLIPYADLLIYPEDWPELSRRRQGDATQQESEANRRVRDRLDAAVPSLSIDNQPFERVVQYLARNQNVNIFVNWRALTDAGIDRTQPISVDLRDVPLRKALTTILAEVGGGTVELGYTIDDGVITISTKDELNSTRYQVVRVYDVRDMLVQPDTTTQPPSFNLQEVTRSGSTTGGSTGGTTGGTGGGGLFDTGGGTGGGTGTNQPRSRAEVVTEILDTIRAVVAPESWRETGGTIGSIRELNGQLIVNQTSDNHVAVYNLLQQLRETRALQIAIEARLLLVSNNFLDDFGFGWNLTIPPGELGSNVGAFSIASNTFQQVTQVNTGVPGSLSGSFTPPNALDISAQILDSWQLSLFLRATQADKRTTTVTAPRVTLFNGQRGYLAVTNQQNFVSNFNQNTSSGGITGNGAVGTNLTVSTLTTGVVLYVEATVSADRRYVVMKLRPQLSSLDGIDTFGAGGGDTQTQGGDTQGGTDDNFFQGGAFVQLPRITYTTVDTMVSVPDGGTLLIGGQKIIGESEIEVGVPVLSKIPGLNRLFTNRSYARDERTLLILVRPKIIIQREEEYRIFGQNFDAAPAGLTPLTGAVPGGAGVPAGAPGSGALGGGNP